MEEDEETSPQTDEEEHEKNEEEIETQIKEEQRDLIWTSCSDVSVGPEGAWERSTLNSKQKHY